MDFSARHLTTHSVPAVKNSRKKSVAIFRALGAETGKLLWEFSLGGSHCEGNSVTYEIDGKQYVLFASGNAFIAFYLP